MMVRSCVSLLLLTVLWACGGDGGTDLEDTDDGSGSTTTTDEFIAQAVTSLEDAMFTALNIDQVSQLDDFSFAESNGLFLDALALSPTNETALFGAAVTEIFLLEDNTEVRTVVEDWEAWLEDEPTTPSPLATLLGPAVTAIGDPVTLPLSFSTETVEQVSRSGMVALELAGAPALVHAPPPSVAELQTVLRDVVRPALVAALGHLLEITNSSFTFTVTPAMQGELSIDADPLELDYTEILALQAGLQLMLAAVDVATAYILSPNPLDAQGFVDAMTPGSTFLTLATGGAAALTDALEELKSAGTLLLSALDELEAETDDQTDDIIKIDPNSFDDLTFQSTQEVADVRAAIQDISDALTSPTEIIVDEGTMYEFSFTLDAREFFITPIDDFKELLAPYEVFTAVGDGETVGVFRWTQLNLDEWILPDPTFSGILPGMSTTSDLFELDFDEFFFEFSLAMGDYKLITVDGNECQAIAQGGGSGCGVGNDFFYDGSVYLDGYDGQSQVYFSPYGPIVSIDSDGSYVVVDNQDGTYTVTMNTVLQDGSNTPLVLTGTLTDIPGFTSTDEFFRDRGGSSLEFSYLGSAFLFERQRY